MNEPADRPGRRGQEIVPGRETPLQLLEGFLVRLLARLPRQDDVNQLVDGILFVPEARGPMNSSQNPADLPHEADPFIEMLAHGLLVVESLDTRKRARILD